MIKSFFRSLPLVGAVLAGGVVPAVCAAEDASELPVILYWPFDSSNPYADASGNGQTITTKTLPVELRGNYAHFPHGTTGDFGRSLSLGGHSAVTIEFFFRQPTRIRQQQCLLSYYGWNGAGTSFFVLFGGGNKSSLDDVTVSWLKSKAGRESESSEVGTLADGAWHHVAMVFRCEEDESVMDELSLYIDGVLQTQSTQAVHHDNFFATKTSLLIGSFHYSAAQTFGAQMQRFEGDVDDLRITAAALTPEQFLSAPTLAETAGEGVVQWTDAAVVPDEGADVHVPATAVVALGPDQQTPRFRSLVIDGVVSFSGVTNCLNADTVHVGPAGRVYGGAAHEGTTVEEALQNRVWIACEDLTVAAGGLISVAGCGFRGGRGIAVGYGPGTKYTLESPICGAGAHGGFSTTIWLGMPPYGSAEWPETAGSGGCCFSANDLDGSDGGGVVRIDATGTVTIDGRVNADAFDLVGYSSYGRACGGAGGSVLVNCRTIAGTGEISARGGRSSGNEDTAGGGGRVAIHYDPTAQTAAAAAGLVLAAQGGHSASQGYGFAENGFKMRAGAGTIWLPDATLITAATLTNFRGRLVNVHELSFDGDVTVNDWVGLAADGARLTVAGNLTITGTNGRLELGSVERATGGMRRSYTSVSPSSLTVGGDLIVTDGARFDVYAAKTNGTQEAGAVIRVGGKLRIAADSRVYPISEPTNGGSPLFVVRDFDLQQAGTFGLSGGGFSGGSGGNNGWGPGYGSAYVGAGHGGVGGRVVESGTTVYGQVYDDELRPSLAGSGGGHYWNGQPGGGCGGGCLRVVANNSIVIAGTVDASGTSPTSYNNGSSGGSGGAVLFDTLSFALTETGTINANGGDSGSAAMNAGKYTSGGGGGRVAIWTGVELWHPKQRRGRWTITDEQPAEYLGTISVSGGASLTSTTENGFAGAAGTIRFVTVNEKRGMALLMR
ncbi:MAG: LamG-like jellyroll fold domain-containing protein [Kiritimatiellia bacterium]